MSQFQKDTLKEILLVEKCTEFAHGDCFGSDAQANDIALHAGIKFITIFPPDNPKKRAFCGDATGLFNKWEWQEAITNSRYRWWIPLPYMERNQLIVDHSQMLIACPKEVDHTVRSGTWSTIRKGWAKQRIDKNFKVVIIPPLEGRK